MNGTRSEDESSCDLSSEQDETGPQLEDAFGRTAATRMTRSNPGQRVSSKNAAVAERSLSGLREQDTVAHASPAPSSQTSFCSETNSGDRDSYGSDSYGSDSYGSDSYGSDSYGSDDSGSSSGPIAPSNRKRKRTPLLDTSVKRRKTGNAWPQSKRCHPSTRKRQVRVRSYVQDRNQEPVAKHNGDEQPACSHAIHKTDDEHETEYEVERIVRARLYGRTLQYQAKWRGYKKDPTWYNASNFKNSPYHLMDFHAANPSQPGPPSRLSTWERCWINGKTAAKHKDDDRPESTCSSLQSVTK